MADSTVSLGVRARETRSDRATLAVNTTGSPLERAAVTYAEHSLLVFPLRGKVPLARLAPRGYLSATKDLDQVRSLWREEPDANIGIACAPSGLLVVDADAARGGDDQLHALEAELGALPDTPRAVTGGGGTHTYLRLPPPPKVRHGTDVLGPGVDVKTWGYTVAPPSVHPNTRRPYEWDVELDALPFALLPERWREALAPAKKRKAPFELGPAILRGTRNSTLTREAGAMRRRGYSVEVIAVVLLALNKQCTDATGTIADPLPTDEVVRIARSIGDKTLGPPWITMKTTDFVAAIRPALNRTERQVLSAVVENAKDDGHVIGGRWIDAKTGISQSVVTRTLRSLLEHGALLAERPVGRTNCYRVNPNVTLAATSV